MMDKEKQSHLKQSNNIIRSGKDVLPYLAEIYEQLYVAPQNNGGELYHQIVQQGQHAPEKDLSHFQMHEKDLLEMVETPAGQVQVITLNERKDFETFLQIMGNKCIPYEVPVTQGAVTMDGVINWHKIREHHRTWKEAQTAKGFLFPDWKKELQQFTSVKSNYTDILILLSVGFYSHIPASVLGFTENKWLEYSYKIRKYHECTHFICRRLYPDQINAVWDEVAADAVGIFAAFGRFDPSLEQIFLGVSEQGYTGGRLENYVEHKELLPDLARSIYQVIMKIEDVAAAIDPGRPFDLAIKLEEGSVINWSEVTV